MPGLITDISNLKNIIKDTAPSRDKKKQKMIHDTVVKAVDEKKRQLRAVLIALKVDRDGEVLLPSGAEYDYFLEAGGVGAYNHSTFGQNLPVVNWLEFEQNEDKLEGVVQFMSKEESPLAEHLWILYKSGKMRAFFHWFLPKEWSDEPVLLGQKGRTFIKYEIMEAGPVMVPSLREAMTSERNLDPICIKAFEEITGEEYKPAEPEKPKFTIAVEDTITDPDEQTGIIPHKRFPLAPENNSWIFSAIDGNAIIEKGSFELYRDAHACHNPLAGEGNPPELRSVYFLPHHKLVGGTLKTIWKGVESSMAGLLGAYGGTLIHEGDRRGVYDHLAQHYKEFEKELPEFKEYTSLELEEMFKDLEGEEIEGSLFPLESAFREPFKSRVVAIPSYDAAITVITNELREAKEDLRKGAGLSGQDLERIITTLKTHSELLKEINELLEDSRSDDMREVTEFITVLDLTETITRSFEILSKMIKT